MIAGMHRWTAGCLVAFATGVVLAPISVADPGPQPPPGSAICVALGQIGGSLQDDIGAGLQPGFLRQYTLSQIVHGVSYMNQVNRNARIQQLDAPLADLTATSQDLQNQAEISASWTEDGKFYRMTAEQRQDLDQISAQQDTLVALVGQLQKSNHCPPPPSAN